MQDAASHMIPSECSLKILTCQCINFECIVTVYTQFGYAQMDVDKYKDDFNPQNMNASPENKPADEQ